MIKKRKAHNLFTYSEVRAFVEGNSTSILLSQKYIKAKEKMLFLCECGEKFETTFNHFKYRGKRKCNKCNGHKRRNIDEIKDMCRNKGLKPLFEEMKSYKEKMLCETREGYLVLVTMDSLKQDRALSIFHTSNPYSIDNVHKYIELHGIDAKCISKEYKGSNIGKMEFECNCGEKFKMHWCDFRSRNHCCYECSVKVRSGKNHYEYNESLTKEERIERRILSSTKNMRIFRESVFERDDYSCDICKDKGVTINAHHLNGYHWFEEGRYDPENGVTMCEICHKDFHKKYGRMNNTKEQYTHYKETFS